MSKLDSLMANAQPIQRPQPMRSVAAPSGSLGAQMSALSQNVGVPIQRIQPQPQQQMGRIPTSMAQLQQSGGNLQPMVPVTQPQTSQVAQALLGQASDMSPNAGGFASMLTKGLQGAMAGYQQNQAGQQLVNGFPQAPSQGLRMGSIFGMGDKSGVGTLGGLY